MKKIIPIILFIIIANCAFSQSVDVRVRNYLGQERLEKLQVNNPDSIDFYNFVAKNSYKIVDANYVAKQNLRSEAIEFSDLEIFTIMNSPMDFDIFQSKINWRANNVRFYVVTGTDKYLRSESYENLVAKFQNKKH